MLSRVADGCLWMSRYLERAEHTSRLLAVRLEAMVQQGEQESADGWRRLMLALGSDDDNISFADARSATEHLSFDPLNRVSLVSSIQYARENARQIREQISSEMWERLNREYLRQQTLTFDEVWDGQPVPFFRGVIDAIHLFKGVTNATMRHGEAWHFIDLGRHLERALLVAQLLEVYFAPQGDGAHLPPPKYFDWLNLLKQCTAFEAYCKVYTAAIEPQRIAEFLIFDPEFPHSIRFAVDKVHAAISEIAPGAPQTRRAACARLAGRLKAMADYGQTDDITGEGIGPFLASVKKQCARIHEAVGTAFITYGVEDAMAG
ncbi:MAG TPA: alpha-E domain-containing protein [Micropepsaceae bacterium]|nr:alpha-E domain-containing protein [Micropepsaceae bacterium]HRK71256.1 alpha-E domain-containing protein [Micropepsaceae bacterium]